MNGHIKLVQIMKIKPVSGWTVRTERAEQVQDEISKEADKTEQNMTSVPLYKRGPTLSPVFRTKPISLTYRG